MSRRNGPQEGQLAAIAAILFGLFILFLGGTCTTILLVDGIAFADSEGVERLLISILAVGAGLFAIYRGVAIIRKDG